MSQYNVYEHEEEVFDSESGDVQRSYKHTVRKVPDGAKDDDFVRVYKYLNVVFAFKQIPLNLVPPLIEISKYMTYASKGQQVVFHRSMRQEISDTLGITLDRLNQIVRQLKERDVLRPVIDENGKVERGVYAVNPFCVGCGSTIEINELRAKFDFDADTMQTEVSRTNLITGKTVKQAIQEVKSNHKQIPGQMRLTNDGSIVEE